MLKLISPTDTTKDDSFVELQKEDVSAYQVASGLYGNTPDYQTVEDKKETTESEEQTDQLYN